MSGEQPEQKTNRIQRPPVGWSAGQQTWKGGKVGVAGAPHPTHQGGAGNRRICVSAPAPEPHSGRAQVASASRWEILELDAWTGWWERPGASRPGAGVRAPQARLARCAEAQPPTAAHRLTRRPSLSTSTRSAREEPPPPGVAGVRWGSVLPRETLQRMETRRDESRRVPRTVGARVSNFRGRGGGAEGRTYYSTGRRALGSLLPLLPLLRPSWRWQPGLPAHMPGPRSDRARAGRGAGRGTPPAVGRGLARDAGPPGCAPSSWPQTPAESSVPAGRRPSRARPLSALRPLPSALCCGRLPAFRGPAPDSPGRGARPPLGSPRPGSVSSRASAADRCARPQTRPAAPGWVPGPALTHFSSKPGLGAGRSRLRGDSTASEEKEGGRQRAGSRRRRGKGGEMEEEGGTESSLLLPAARSILPSTAGNLWWKGKS